MAPQPNSGPLQPPGSDGTQQQGGSPGGGFPADPAVPDPNEMGKRLVTELVTTARRLGMKYPSMIAEVREITNGIAPKMLQKLVQSQPAPEPMAPPV
jgi:hypothetical protein